jgi:molybdopterin-guanine dinucleotide biosynthesis protein B
MVVTRIPMLGFAAFSGTGKTTLLTRLLPLLRTRGLRIGMVKHAHHGFDIDRPGKDSYELRRAGAGQMLVASARRWVLMVEEGDGLEEPDLHQLVERLDQDALDLILVEGFKHEDFPKIELHRPSMGQPLMCLDDPNIIALATDAEPAQAPPVPLLDLNRVEEIEACVLDWLRGR